MNLYRKCCGLLSVVAAMIGCGGADDLPPPPAAASAEASAGSTRDPIPESPENGEPIGSKTKDAGAEQEHREKPEAVTYPMVKSDGLEADEPERAVALFLEAWQHEDWPKMAAITLPSWRRDQIEPEALLKTWFDTSDLRGASIESHGIRGYAGQVECKVHYAVGSTVKTYSTLVRIIHEDATGRRWKGGTWSVDPVLTFREEK